MDILSKIFFGNSVQNWLLALAVFTVGWLIIRVFKRVILKSLKRWSLKSKANLDDFFIETVEKSVVPLFYLAVFRLGLGFLDISPAVSNVVYVATLLFLTFFILRIITSVIRQFVFSYIETKENSETKEKQAKGLLLIVNIVIWILGIVFIIDNLGYNVTTLITGLGIGGIAIALAAQTILGDLFSYFVIFFDRPFEIGDFIIVEDKMGTIEYIGLKTTRVRTLSGEQLICSNTYLTNSRVHNFKRMDQRRVVFKLGVTYQTAPDVIKKIPGLVRSIIESTDNVTFDRGHFSGFGDFSLNFEFVYYILSAEYNVYMDKQQEIYFNVLTQFEEQKIHFAYPTQTIAFAPLSSPPGIPVQR